LKSNRAQLKVIEQKIADKTRQLSEPTTFAGAKPLSRHEMDLEKAVTRDRDSTKVFHCLVTNKSVDSVDPDHPINHLDQIWKDVLSSKPTCRRRRKRKRGAAVVTDDIASGAGDVTSVNTDSGDPSEDTVHKSVCCEEVSVKSVVQEGLESSSTDNCKQSKCSVEPVPIEVIERHRLSVDEIRQLPRFQNYNAGTPSQVCSSFVYDFHNGHFNEFNSVLCRSKY